MRAGIILVFIPWEIGLGFVAASVGWSNLGAALLATAIVSSINVWRHLCRS